jgi:hypothetical protein
MKRFAWMIGAALALLASRGVAHAGWGSLTYGGYQPWWNVFSCHTHCMTCEEERLQQFWHDYYHALKCYYNALDKIDWVAYYKNHGYQINAACGGVGGPGCGPCGGGGCARVNYAPVFVSPTMQWAIPNGCANGPPAGCGPAGAMPGYGPACGPGGCGGPMGPMAPGPMGPMGAMAAGY